jgi:hypothetical protein
MIRWIHVLTEFDCKIRHRSGKLNPVADYLSRPSILIMLPVSKGALGPWLLSKKFNLFSRLEIHKEDLIMDFFVV